MIKHFSESGHEVTVASLARSGRELLDGEGILEYCNDILVERVSELAATGRMIGCLAGRTPSSMGYFYSPRLKRRIDLALKERKYDLIFVHCSSVAQYVEDVGTVPKMLDFGDMDSQKWLLYSKVRRFPLSAGYWLEGVKLKRAEIKLAQKFDFCTCTTKAELKTLDDYGVSVPTGWFPNGVDLDYFQPTNDSYDSDRICFVGRMDYYPNQRAMIEFCHGTLPLIRKKHPGVRLQIVGAAPSRKIKELSGLEGVEVIGTVPDVRPFVLKSAVSIAPLGIARGTQNKILESMAMGVPVVASGEASGGVDAEPGIHLQVASNPESFAEAVLRLLENRSERLNLSRMARERMETHHNWNESMKRLDDLVAKCILSRCGRDKVDPGVISMPGVIPRSGSGRQVDAE